MGVAAEASIQKKGTFTAQENVDFSDANQPYVYDAGGVMDPTRSLQDTSDATLDNFFSRPLKIYDVQWDTGTSLWFSIDPWSLYFENPRVINRLTNYKLLKAQLHVKFVINGNGFQYGRAVASYIPLKAFDSLTTTLSLVREHLVLETQRPHVFLDPTTSSGGELVLPMFWHKNYLDIQSNEWANMGEMIVRSINDLKHANGATDQVTISVFAWAEDVSMSVLTSRDPSTLVPQMGEIDEANAKGIISQPASVIAKCAGMLKSIPTIAPFALATEITATAIGNVAKVFGYSRPLITKAPDPFVPRPFGQLALTNVPDNCFKLTVDEKQELSIDPRIAGISGGVDPLNVKSIASRESYLTTFSWNIGTAPETLLWNSRIDPTIWAEDAGPPVEYYFPACAIAALPFKFWTGSMKFRFQIVCSSFHRGRLKVVYDPEYISTNEYNTNYLHVVDISETKDFTIEIGNGQEKTLLDHVRPGINPLSNVYSTTRFTTAAPGNGVVAVYVVNELTTPNSTVTNDIEVNVFVSMGDDFEVFVPDDHFQRFVYQPQMGFMPQSGEIVPSLDETEEPSAPVHEQAVNLGPSLQDDTLINKVYVGECITSFRQMLKRYNLHTSVGFDGNTNVSNLQLQMPGFPYLRGKVLGAVHVAVGPIAYNFCNTVMLHWVSNCFSGWRGSMRWKAMPRGGYNAGGFKGMRMEASRFSDNATYLRRITTPVPGYLLPSDSAHSAVVETPGGAVLSAANKPHSAVLGSAVTIGDINPCLEWEIPFYSDFRFMPGKLQDWTTSIFFGGTEFSAILDPEPYTTIDFYCAAGEDYTPYFWTGCPVMYYEPNPPTPA